MKEKMGSMSSLAGRATQTKYMSGGSQSPEQMGAEEGFPGHEAVKVVHHVGEHTNHSSEYASAHHQSASTKISKMR